MSLLLNTCCARRFGLGLALVGALAAVAFTGACGRDAASGGRRRVRIAAASDLRYAFEEVTLALRRQHPDVEPAVTFGSSGTFFAQLMNRAPFDLFLSADMAYPKKLADERLARAGSEFTYAFGHIVLWVPAQSPIDVEALGIDALRAPSVQRIAIANPETAPYGRAAEAALRRAGVYESIKPTLVLGENVAQTLQFAQSGAADVAIVALSLVRAPALKDAGRLWEVPHDWYPPIEQGGVILPWATDPDAAALVRAFLLGPDGRAILTRYGFSLPGA